MTNGTSGLPSGSKEDFGLVAFLPLCKLSSCSPLQLLLHNSKYFSTLCGAVCTESSQIIEQVTDPTLPGTGSTLRALCELRIAQITRSIKEPGAWGEWRGPETAAGDKE